jgi:hypothetical protein
MGPLLGVAEADDHRRAVDEEVGQIADQMYDVKEFLALCQSNPEEALLRISKVEGNVPGTRGTYPIHLFKFVALSQKALGIVEATGNIADTHTKAICEESLREYLRAREFAISRGADSVLKDFAATLLEVARILEKCAPGRAQELLGKNVENIAALLTKAQVGETPMPHTTLRDLFLANQLSVRGADFTEDQLFLVRNASDVQLTASFPIRSAWVYFMRYPTAVQEVRGTAYSKVLQPDGVPPIDYRSQDLSFVLAKDLRKKTSGEPVDPKSYGRWIFYSSEEYKRVEEKVAAAAKASAQSGCVVATATFGDASSAQVTALRTFRDERLLPNRLGRLGIEVYYRVSPRIAALVRSSPALKALTRVILELLVACLPSRKTLSKR